MIGRIYFTYFGDVYKFEIPLTIPNYEGATAELIQKWDYDPDAVGITVLKIELDDAKEL